MAALTGGTPKELVTLGRRTVLERVVDEAMHAEVDEIVVVSSPAKPAIEEAVNEWSKGRFRDARLRVAYQSEARGLADAVFSADVEDDVLVLLGDCVFNGGSPVERMSNLVYRGIDGCIAVESVSDADVSRYGICEVNEMGSISRILEKPKPNETQSRWAVAARFAFSARILARIAELAQGITGPDLPLTPLIAQAIAEGADLKAVALQPGMERVDCGTPEEYQAARRMPWD